MFIIAILFFVSIFFNKIKIISNSVNLLIVPYYLTAVHPGNHVLTTSTNLSYQRSADCVCSLSISLLINFILIIHNLIEILSYRIACYAICVLPFLYLSKYSRISGLIIINYFNRSTFNNC